MATQESVVDGTVGAGFKPAHTTAAPQNSPNSPICVVLQLAPLCGWQILAGAISIQRVRPGRYRVRRTRCEGGFFDEGFDFVLFVNNGADWQRGGDGN